jgi:glutathione S-transferase
VVGNLRLVCYDRLALNFKGANYQTRWVELPEITSVRKELGVAPNRTLPDGSPLHTLPIIKNTSTAEVIGDSFEIALYLDKIYPTSPMLFPPSTVGLQKAFNVQVDAIFTNHVLLMADGIPFNPETAEVSKKTFVDRFGANSWDDFTVKGDERAKKLASFESALGDLAKFYKQTEFVFLNGESPCYADLIVGGWLGYVKATTPEWKDVKTWHDGFLGKLDEALAQYAIVR